MLEFVFIDGKARGIIVCNLDIGEIECYVVYVVVLAIGGYGKIYYFFILVMGCNGLAIWWVYKKGVGFVFVSWIQIYFICLL